MKTPEELNLPQADNSAFTRADLLALLSVLALLALIGLPSLGRVTGKTAIAQCAANLQQYDLALQIYGNENQDNLPFNHGAQNVLEANTNIVCFITNTGVKWTALYCPGTSVRFTEQDNMVFLTPILNTGLSILGYANTLVNPDSFVPAPFGNSPAGTDINGNPTTFYFYTNQNTNLTIQRVQFFNLSLSVRPAARPLLADATLDLNTADEPSASVAQRKTFNWVSHQGGYPSARRPITAHLHGIIPAGGNIGMLDGHVEWHDFTNQLPRSGGNGDPYFYW